MEGSLFCLKITIHLRQAHQPGFERVVIGGGLPGGREWIRRMPKYVSGHRNRQWVSLQRGSLSLSLLAPTLHCLITSCFLPPGRVFLHRSVLISGRYGKVIVTLLSSGFWRVAYGDLSAQLREEKVLVSLPFFVFNVGKQQCTTPNLTVWASFVSDSSPFHWTQSFKVQYCELDLICGNSLNL